MTETITIPKQDYLNLLKYKKILELESSLDFTRNFLKKLEKAEKAIREDKGIKLKSKKEVELYFENM